MKYLYILLFVLPLIGFGQGWEQTFGGEDEDYSYFVQQTTDEGYIIIGTTYSFGSGSKIYLIKTDINGGEQWSQTFESGQGNSGQQTIDGGYIVTGSTYSPVSELTGLYLLKTSSDGEGDWFQIFGEIDYNFVGYSVQQTTDEGYIVTGSKYSTVSESTDLYILKTSSDGEEIWSQTFDGEFSYVGHSVQQTTDGGYIITGFSGGLDNENDVVLLKIDEDGNEEWSQTFGGSGGDLGYSVQQTTDGGYIITGGTWSFGNGENDVFLIKTDISGNEEWFQTFGGTSYDEGISVQQTTDGGYIITGYTRQVGFGGGYNDVYLIKTDLNGNEEWSQTFGGVSHDIGYCVRQTTDNGYIISGYTVLESSELGYNDVYLIKTNVYGNITSTIELPTPTSKRELFKTINILGQENTTIKNQPLIKIYDDGSTEKKIVIE